MLSFTRQRYTPRSFRAFALPAAASLALAGGSHRRLSIRYQVQNLVSYSFSAYSVAGYLFNFSYDL